ncbi:MAG TPA: cell division protein FtsL [Metalysinibacillus jejuensis]|uniref:Cell division protein FtsL n=1 Tax=Metalysinibacillus jejuensis TaxID=914327 RepID=A0A921T475_9BACL|nr:cell division protein FtsL [Metalysinibacillus jejuensis]HJH10308.1 cell division protein FtsL [Metalysinibacillus jejuensis]
MAERAYQQLPNIPQQTPQAPPSQKPKAPKKAKKHTPFEKLLLAVFIVAFIGLATLAVSRQVTLYEMTREIKSVELETKAKLQENKELKATLTELSQPERIWKKAESLGLTQSEQNVKVVPAK